MERSAKVERTTAETRITLNLNVDGSGVYAIETPVPFLTHMLELFAKHGHFDLSIRAAGDVQVDSHHTVEDIGICLGQAFSQALKDKKDIVRYGDAVVPMDEARAQATLDISGRPFLKCSMPALRGRVGDFDLELVEEFFQAFTNHSATTLHITVASGKNSHHIVEAVFKAFARALDKATHIDARGTGIPSTKGVL